ncbi:hypothetical protein BROUX41_005815 [Berkeleyomyces rouxiae]|uniref:uncharacterized protein n=1 Tax=Berkeleyomyces rouxiae TaxID=2035830 RepID=UPI003B7A33AE
MVGQGKLKDRGPSKRKPSGSRKSHAQNRARRYQLNRRTAAGVASDRGDRQDITPQNLIAKKAVPQLKHQTYIEIVDNVDKKQKKLELEVTFKTEPPEGFEFVPIGNPELTALCKDISREKAAMIYVVSNSKTHKNELSVHVNRMGHHVLQSIVQEARKRLGYQGTSTVTDALPETQELINAQADAALRDLFPRIPNTDRQEIIDYAFRLGAKFHGEPVVGVQTDLSLSRRVQLAVLAHIRHNHTRYDELLRETSWMHARKAVEQPCLDVLVRWRGDEENGRDSLDEILREVVIISDDEDEGGSGSDENDDSDDDEVEAGAEPLSSRSTNPNAMFVPRTQRQATPNHAGSSKTHPILLSSPSVVVGSSRAVVHSPREVVRTQDRGVGSITHYRYAHARARLRDAWNSAVDRHRNGLEAPHHAVPVRKVLYRVTPPPRPTQTTASMGAPPIAVPRPVPIHPPAMNASNILRTSAPSANGSATNAPATTSTIVSPLNTSMSRQNVTATITTPTTDSESQQSQDHSQLPDKRRPTSPTLVTKALPSHTSYNTQRGAFSSAQPSNIRLTTQVDSVRLQDLIVPSIETSPTQAHPAPSRNSPLARGTNAYGKRPYNDDGAVSPRYHRAGPITFPTRAWNEIPHNKRPRVSDYPSPSFYESTQQTYSNRPPFREHAETPVSYPGNNHSFSTYPRTSPQNSHYGYPREPINEAGPPALEMGTRQHPIDIDDRTPPKPYQFRGYEPQHPTTARPNPPSTHNTFATGRVAIRERGRTFYQDVPDRPVAPQPGMHDNGEWVNPHTPYVPLQAFRIDQPPPRLPQYPRAASHVPPPPPFPEYPQSYEFHNSHEYRRQPPPVHPGPEPEITYERYRKRCARRFSMVPLSTRPVAPPNNSTFYVRPSQPGRQPVADYTPPRRDT